MSVLSSITTIEIPSLDTIQVIAVDCIPSTWESINTTDSTLSVAYDSLKGIRGVEGEGQNRDQTHAKHQDIILASS